LMFVVFTLEAMIVEFVMFFVNEMFEEGTLFDFVVVNDTI